MHCQRRKTLEEAKSKKIRDREADPKR